MLPLAGSGRNPSQISIPNAESFLKLCKGHLREKWYHITPQNALLEFSLSIAKDVEYLEHFRLFGGTPISIITLENYLAVLMKAEHTHILNRNEVYNNVHSSIIKKQSSNCKQPKRLLIGEWANELWYSRIMEYYIRMKKNKLLIHTKTCVNLTDVILSRRSYKQRIHTI